VTVLLASVAGLAELDAALAGGAGAIDWAGPPGTLRDCITAVAGQHPVSIAVNPAEAAQAATAGADPVRVAIAHADDIDALASLARHARLLAVLDPSAAALLPDCAEAGFVGAMLETRPHRLLDRLPFPDLVRFATAARAHNLLSGFGGCLELPDIPRLLVLQPGLLRFGHALHESGRVAANAVRRIRSAMPAPAQPDAAPSREGPLDCVFVHDVVLPCHIGAYARELGPTQPVRFSVDAYLRPGRPVAALRDTLSYDVIRDSIRLLAESGHVELVETLAERLAASLLEDGRVARVRIQVEKLTTPSGTNGVLIERTARRGSLP